MMHAVLAFAALANVAALKTKYEEHPDDWIEVEIGNRGKGGYEPGNIPAVKKIQSENNIFAPMASQYPISETAYEIHHVEFGTKSWQVEVMKNGNIDEEKNQK